jgi:hypothetical protein
MRVRERWLALESAFPGEHIEQSQPDCPRSIYVPTEREWPPPDGRDDGPRTPRGLGCHVLHKPGGFSPAGESQCSQCYIERQVERFTKCLSTETDLAERTILSNC